MVNYWLFIVPEDGFPGILWEKCIEDEVLAMEYLSDYKGYTRNIKLIKEMKEEDLVVAYLRKKRIGGIGKVNKEYFDAEIPYDGCGYDGYRQRIGVEWLYVKSEKYPTIDFKKVLGSRVISGATIHSLTENEYNKFIDVFQNRMNNTVLQHDVSIKTSNVLESKKQIIFYGPPGTGKTYNARNFAVKFIEEK